MKNPKAPRVKESLMRRSVNNMISPPSKEESERSMDYATAKKYGISTDTAKKARTKEKPETDKEKKLRKQAADETMDRNMQEAAAKPKGYAKGGMVKGDFKTPGGLNSRGNGAARRGNRGS
jgi:hypothetical protein